MFSDIGYTRLVAGAKIALPLIALALLSSLFLLSKAPDPDAALPYANIDLDQLAREQRLSEPRFAGVLDGNRPLVIEAQSVSANTGQTEVIMAQDVTGSLVLDAADTVDLAAAHARFDLPSQLAFLEQDVRLTTTSGYLLESTALALGLSEVSIRSEVPVRILGPEIEITADQFEITGPAMESIARFTGSVRVVYGTVD